jgi:class 3 adenylate cyclase
MQKVLAIGATTARHLPLPAEGRVVEFPGAAERTGRTFVCSVLFLDIVEYSKKPIGEQLQAKERFNAQVSQAIAEIPVADRIILDTGDGVAISFLGDPEDALCVALALAPAVAADATAPARIGINLGPVRLTRDINGQPNIVGDGINVAQRVMSFARPGQILISRGYHEVVARIDEAYAALFSYQGSRTDKHVREHEIFELSASLGQAAEVAQRRKQARRHKHAQVQPNTAGGGLLRNRTLAWAATAGSSALLVAALISTFGADKGEPAAPAPRAPASAPSLAAAPPTVESAPTATAAAQHAPALADGEPGEAPGAEPATAHAAPTRSKPAAGAAKPAAKPSANERPLYAAPPVAIPAPRESAADKPAGAGLWKPEPPAPAAAKAPAGPTALVVLAISPWGEVFVDGKSAGVSPPLAELELTPGKHRIVVRNGSFKPLQEDVELGSNETIRIKHKFVSR